MHASVARTQLLVASLNFWPCTPWTIAHVVPFYRCLRKTGLCRHIPLQFVDHEVHTWIEDDIDIQISRADHAPICLEIALWKPNRNKDTDGPAHEERSRQKRAEQHPRSWSTDVNIPTLISLNIHVVRGL